MSGVQHLIATLTLASGRQLMTELRIAVPGDETIDSARACLRHGFAALDIAAEQHLTPTDQSGRQLPRTPSRHSEEALTAVIPVTR